MFSRRGQTGNQSRRLVPRPFSRLVLQSASREQCSGRTFHRPSYLSLPGLCLVSPRSLILPYFCKCNSLRLLGGSLRASRRYHQQAARCLHAPREESGWRRAAGGLRHHARAVQARGAKRRGHEGDVRRRCRPDEMEIDWEMTRRCWDNIAVAESYTSSKSS